MTNISDIKHDHNIVDYIKQYLPLKKMGGNWSCCCPFHNENSPSFTVTESKQFYHCFGCGANGDIIAFIINYSGEEYVDACKILGADAALMPSQQVSRNRAAQRNTTTMSMPPDHKQDVDKCAEILSKCQNIDGQYRDNDGNIYAPVINSSGEIINLYDGFDFITGGISYSGFTPINKKDNKNFLLVTLSQDAYKIAEKYNVNVLICYSSHNLKYVYKNANKDEKLKPVLTILDDDFLAYEMDYIEYLNGILTKREMKL